MKLKLLILSADDFGTGMAVNKTIERLYSENAITTAGIVVRERFSEDAMGRAADLGMNVGIQWQLNDFMGEADGAEILFELEDQISILAGWGLTPDHATNPSNSLISFNNQSFSTEAFMACSGYEIPFRMAQSYDSILGAVDPVTLEYIEAYGMALRPALESAWLFNVKLPNVSISVYDPAIESYEALKAAYLKLLSALPNGISVLYFRPCDESDESKALYSDWQRRAWEARLLTDPDFKAALDSFIVADYQTAFDPITYPESLT